MDPLAWLLGAGGFALGLGADRFATRWPEHDDEHPPGRAVDWRTGVVALIGALAFGLLPLRFASDPLALVLFGAWFATLVVGLGTDLDQRLLAGPPDPAGHPGRPRLRAERRQPPGRGRGRPGRGRRARHPGGPLPSVDPVRRGRVRPRRRQAARRRRADGRRQPGARIGRSSPCSSAGSSSWCSWRPVGSDAGPTSRSARSSSSGRCGRCSSAPERSRSDPGPKGQASSTASLGRLAGYHAVQAGVVLSQCHFGRRLTGGRNRQTPPTGWSRRPRSLLAR